MGSRPAAPRSWPALDVRFPVRRASLLADLVLATLDDFQPSAIQEAGTTGSLRVFFGSADARDRARASLRRLSAASGLSLDPVEIPDEDWAARSQADLRSVVAGRIIVAPPWDHETRAGAAGAVRIVIEPSMGFGTGHHPSTRLCLLALQMLDLRGRWVLDLGTGSGLLALAAVRLGATRAIAVDTDPDALAAARENLERNAATEAVDLRLGDLRALSGLQAPVVLANLTGALLTTSSAHVTSLVEPHGHLIASGFTDGEAGVMPALEARLSTVHVAREDEWVCAVLQRA